MASKDLKVNVIVNAKTKQLDQMFRRLNKMQTKINQQAKAQDAVTRSVLRTNAAHKKSKTLIDQLTTKVHRLANAYLGVMAAKAAMTASDTITSAENKLNHLNNGDTAATQSQLDKMYTSAQKVRIGYSNMMSNVAKSMTLAGDAFDGNIDNAIRFQEIMSKAYTLSGSSAAEMSSSMYQMIQGLGSGILQGDELRSVREGASLAYKAIEEFAQGIYGAEENLKDLASEGKITSDIVVAAILKNGEKMDAAFDKTSMTFAQAWIKIKNTALKSFEPVLQKLNDLLNSPVGQAIVNGIGKAIQIVAGALMIIFNIIETVFTFVQDNWPIISKILLTAAAILGGVLLYYLFLQLMTIGIVIKKLLVAGATMVATAIKWVVSWATMSLPMLLVIILIAAIVIALIWMSDSFTDACGIVVGSLYWMWAVFKNIFKWMGNVALALWESIKAIGTNIGIAFENAWNAAKSSFWSFIANCLEGLKGLEPAINAVARAFGAEGFTLSGLIENVSAKASGYESKGYVSVGDAWKTGYNSFEYSDTSDAYDKGYKIGSDAGQWVTDKLSGIGGKISEALNLGGLPNIDLDSNLGNIAANTGDIDDNTGKMADSMKLTEEDLAYLRKVANMEWKKEFTTANITVDMTNNNTVSNDFDLNSLAIGLRDLVEEEMFTVANGVYV